MSKLAIGCALLTICMSVAMAADPQREAARQRLIDKLKERRQKAPAPTAAAGTQSLKHADKDRTYRLHRPKGTATGQPVPLVIVLHGFGADGGMTEVLSGFDAVADKHGFAVVYPDGIGRMWRFWENLDGRVAAGSPDDVGFIAALIDQLVQTKVADPRRVYVTGISNGGFMSNRLGCSLSDKVAAIAPVAGSMPKFMAEKLKAPRVMPTMTFHGTDDRVVKPNGEDIFSKTETSLSATELAAWWAKSNGCTAKPATESMPDTADDGTRVTRHSYRNAKGEALVIHYEITGGGHTWPGGSFQPEFLLGKTTKDINASELMWEFFQKHSLPAETKRKSD